MAFLFKFLGKRHYCQFTNSKTEPNCSRLASIKFLKQKSEEILQIGQPTQKMERIMKVNQDLMNKKEYEEEDKGEEDDVFFGFEEIKEAAQPPSLELLHPIKFPAPKQLGVSSQVDFS